MPIQVLMPALSPTMEKGNLAKWVKHQGDKVKSGDIIAEIETDKATMEVEATDEGTLGQILVPEGTADVAVNTPIAVILSEGEDAGPWQALCHHPAAMIPAHVGHWFGLSGPNIIIPTACAAGNYSIGWAFDAIRFGRADVMVAGGTDPFSRVAFTGFAGAAASTSPAISAIGVLTLTPSVPAGTRIFCSRPSSTASTSMVALSVSISAMTSPDRTVSPGFTCHLARVPSSMVGDRAGISTSVTERPP